MSEMTLINSSIMTEGVQIARAYTGRRGSEATTSHALSSSSLGFTQNIQME
jgi:hypothetical protein